MVGQGLARAGAVLVLATAAPSTGCTDVAPETSELPESSHRVADGGTRDRGPGEPGEPGAPDAAVELFTASISASGLGIPIPDDGYTGGLSGGCIDTYLAANDVAYAVRLQVGIEHPAVGDLSIHVLGPNGALATLLSRPGHFESADNGADAPGDDSNLSSASPVWFDSAASQPAESMGVGLASDEVVCADDGVCAFAPGVSPGPGGKLVGFVGGVATGTWRICVGDSNPGQVGVFDSFSLELDVPAN